MKWARSSMLWVYIRRSRYEMLFGVGWPWWSAQTARGEPANARLAPAAVHKNSRRVGWRILCPKFRGLAILEFRILALVLFIILGGSLAHKTPGSRLAPSARNTAPHSHPLYTPTRTFTFVAQLHRKGRTAVPSALKSCQEIFCYGLELLVVSMIRKRVFGYSGWTKTGVSRPWPLIVERPAGQRESCCGGNC